MSNHYDSAVGHVAGWISYWTQGGSDLQSTGDALDAQLAQMNNADYAPGGRLYNQIQATQGTAAANAAWQAVQNHEASGQTGDVQQQLIDAATQGASEGRKSFWSFVWNLITSTIGLIPWWVWILGLVGIFLWLGGFTWLAKKSKGILK